MRAGGRDARSAHCALYSKSGHEPGLRSQAAIDAGVLMYDLEELVRKPLPEPEDMPRP